MQDFDESSRTVPPSPPMFSDPQYFRRSAATGSERVLRPMLHCAVVATMSKPDHRTSFRVLYGNPVAPRLPVFWL